MKTFVAFALLIAGISAFPQLPKQYDLTNERLVSDNIASAIQDVSDAIQALGLDPLHIESFSLKYNLPVEVLFGFESEIVELLCEGLSNIVINRINFSLITTRLTFDISLPGIKSSLEKAETKVVFFGKTYTASASGSLAINEIRLTGNIRVSVGVISGISIRSIEMTFDLAGIESALNVVIQNWDISNWLNTFLGTTIPTTLKEYSSEINELLEILIKEIAESIL